MMETGSSPGLCDEVQTAIDMDSAGALAASEAQALRQHLGECPTCRAYVVEVEQQQALLRGQADEARAAVDWKRLQSALDRLRSFKRYAWYALAVLVGMLLWGEFLRGFVNGLIDGVTRPDLPPPSPDGASVGGRYLLWAALIAAATTWVWMTVSWRQAWRARQQEPSEWIGLLRHHLDRQLVGMRRVEKLFLATGGLFVVALISSIASDPGSLFRGTGNLIGSAAGVCSVLAWAYLRLVHLPRLQRERASLE